MEFRSAVFNAAKDGKLQRLKVFLDHKPREEVRMLVSATTNGATPLVMASRNGHLDVADYLLDRCQADIEQVGSVSFEGETIEGAPPLWCAAAAGHLSVVQRLVERGASACFDGHLAIVRYLVEQGADLEIANRHGHTCLMIACYKGHLDIARYLVARGAQVNRQSAKGNTALHDCAESGSLDILRLLLEHGARAERDAYGLTPLLAAAVTGHAPVKRDSPRALALWRRALEERCLDPPLPKPSRPTTAAYGHAVEASSPADLDDLLCEPDQMRMQALLVRERVLGPAHPDTAYYIRYRGAVYADLGDFGRCVALWLYALDMQQRCLEPFSPMTQSSLLSFAELFCFMMAEARPARPSRRQLAPVEFAHVLAVFERAVAELESAGQDSSEPAEGAQRTLVITLQLAALLCRLQSVRRWVRNWVEGEWAGFWGRTPTRWTTRAAPRCTWPPAASPVQRAAALALLARGAHLDRTDRAGRTPLDYAPALVDCSPLRFTGLQCLCARAILRYGLPFRGLVPRQLESFVLCH
ncbi:hypothetical protein HPB48_011625 [Haemaphysalis longicornis]|uniref:Sex-determining protein fem-1 n=1 Tax=Haemaphysalis longicornis TaxID=44386 RepID=A0A9J6G5S7_HAELO|nr:hypothetical protein HPB48_011625 [Haemaphysalis longicornis]